MIFRIILPLLIIAASLAEAKKIQIRTSFYPLTYMATRIAGQIADVTSPVPLSTHPTYWKPTRKDILGLHQADLILLNGAKLEKWTSKVTLPAEKVLVTTMGFKGEYINVKKAVSHSHGEGKKHSHKGINRFTWLDPVNFMRQAEAITKKLVEKYPGQKNVFEMGYKGLKIDFEELDKKFQELSTGKPDKPLITSHPVYNYISRRYNWNTHDLHLEPHQMPDAKTLAEIKTLNKKLKCKYLIWEAQPKKSIAARIKKETGLESVVFNTCIRIKSADLKKGDDYLKVMRRNLEVMKQVFSEQ